MKTGFTLIELLVVVLIIGILAAIALPQYQKAVLKSRYSGLMPITAAVANAQEIYYMEHGNYAPPSRTSDLAIQIPNNTNNVEIEVSDESDTHFNYVMASRDDLPGVAYVIYQKHSEQFPGTIMCEANEELNSQSTWLCHNSLRGNQVTGSLLGNGWTAYVLEGSGSGDFSAGETTDLTGSFTVDDLNDTFKDIFSSGCCADDWEDYWEDTQDAGRTVSVISPNEIIVYDTDGSEYDHYLFNPTEHYMDVIAASGYITRRYLNESNNSYTCYQSISPTGEILINGC